MRPLDKRRGAKVTAQAIHFPDDNEIDLAGGGCIQDMQEARAILVAAGRINQTPIRTLISLHIAHDFHNTVVSLLAQLAGGTFLIHGGRAIPFPCFSDETLT